MINKQTLLDACHTLQQLNVCPAKHDCSEDACSGCVLDNGYMAIEEMESDD